MVVAQGQTKPRALVHPMLDFWLLGGFSYLGLLAIWAAVDVYGANLKYDIPWWAFYAAFVVNYPHFAYSYQLFYKGYTGRLFGPETEMISRLRLLVAGIIVPALMIGYFAHVGMVKDRGMLGYGVSAMLFFVGWHYVKQGYGVLITASVYKNIFYGLWQKRVLYINAYAVWIYAWIRGNKYVENCFSAQQCEYHGVRHMAIHMPDWAGQAAMAVMVVTSILSLLVILSVWLREKKGVSWGGLVGYTSASYFWILLAHVHPLFFYFIPLFHSLQYLAFVYKFKKSEFLATKDRAPSFRVHLLKLAGFILAGFILGGVMMDWLPKWFDAQVAGQNLGFTRNYFLVSFLLFINIHHFFIDSAFWRRDNKAVQDFLFRA